MSFGYFGNLISKWHEDTSGDKQMEPRVLGTGLLEGKTGIDNGDRWERLIARNLELDAPYR